MQVSNLFSDDDAVSPVIGVILMVAITVILAAVIGAFVLNIGGNQDTAPQASWEWTNSSDGVELSMTSGNQVDANEIYITGPNGYEQQVGSLTGVSELNAGNSIYIGNSSPLAGEATGNADTLSSGPAANPVKGDVEISLVWRSSQSDKSSILDTFTTP